MSMDGTAHAWELSQKCTFFVVSLSCGAGHSWVLVTHCQELALPLRGVSSVDGTEFSWDVLALHKETGRLLAGSVALARSFP